MMDFSVSQKPIRFKVDDDIFEAVPDIAAELAMEYADLIEKVTSRADDDSIDVEEQKQVVYSTIRLVMFPESAERFIARLSDQQKPISQKKFGEITAWLMEQYGLRPTESDSASSTGSENQDAGTSSTVST